MTQLLDNTCKSTIFANIRTPAEDEKSSENYDYYGFLLKSIELQLDALFHYPILTELHYKFLYFLVGLNVLISLAFKVNSLRVDLLCSDLLNV